MKIAILALLILQVLTPLSAKNYFIRLNERGLAQRQAILNTSPGLLKSAPHLRLRTLGEAVPFQRWLTVEGDSTDFRTFVKDMTSAGFLSFYEPVGHFKIRQSAQDSLRRQQWYLDKINLEQAWLKTRGVPEIIVGVIDTGVDYHHPDLIDGLWRNQAELDGLNGVDDDQNGYIDDVIGWDFTDVPRFPDGGDYLDEDNDPMDEFGSGHGTQVAGLIAAQTNSLGITGIAPDLKVMILRAGTASGYLEEDDVVRAILYAIANGARVINMSFGDTALSQLLRDVLRYAHDQGVVLVTSAGNSGDDQIQFPAALEETISVGATTINDYPAGFTSYGSTTDLVAPGDSILSTAVGGGYNIVNGTSFSAPMVSAVCGLILSINPGYSPEQVRNILKTSSDDIYYSGWDMFTGAGRLNGGNAVSVPQAGTLEIISPASNLSTALDTLWLKGTILHPDLLSADLAYGMGKDPQQWITLRHFERRQVFEDTLAHILLASIPDTIIEIRLKMDLIDGQSDELHRLLRIDRSAPKISDLQMEAVFDGLERSALIAFKTDDFCRASVLIKPSDGSSFSIRQEFPYAGQNHILKIPNNILHSSDAFYIQVTNASGLSTKEDNGGMFYMLDLEFPVDWQAFSELPWDLPSGFFLDKALDLDGDGQQEIMLSRYDSDFAYGPVEIYEFRENKFIKTLETGFTAIPRDAGDVDADGKADMLLGYGQHSFLFESLSAEAYPSDLVWSDTVDFWAAGYADLDGNGHSEIIGRKDDEYVALEASPNNQFTMRAQFPNTSAGANQFGTPRIRTADINGDGSQELLFGDYDGDLLVYGVNSAFEPNLIQILRSTQEDATNLIALDEDHLFVASHTTDKAYLEHEVDARFWSIDYFIYDQGSQQFQKKQTLHFGGYKNQKEFDSGLQTARMGQNLYLIASFFPRLYVFQVSDSGLVLSWFQQGVRSNAPLVADFNQDGWDEFYVNDGERIVGFTDGPVLQPQKPLSFIAQTLDSSSAILHWQAPSPNPIYRLYRGTQKDSLTLLLETRNTEVSDSGLLGNTWYFYALAVLDSSFSIPLGPRSETDSIFTEAGPQISEIISLNDHQLKILFNREVRLIQDKPAQARLVLNAQQTNSLTTLPQKQGLLCSFYNPFKPGLADTIELKNIFSKFGTPMPANSNSWPFKYTEPQRVPIVESSKIISRNTAQIYFNMPMSRLSLLNSENYVLSPSGTVDHISVIDSSDSAIELKLSAQTLAGGLGQPAYLELQNLFSKAGQALVNGARVNLYSETLDLDQILVYPQPLRPDQHRLIFAKVPQNAQISVFDLQGNRIWEQRDPVTFGGVQWDLRDLNGRAVSSGIYLYEIVLEQKRKLGKVVLVR